MKPRNLLRHISFVAVVGLALTACGGGDSNGPSRPNLDGGWSGSNAGITLTMALNENRSSVTGDGNITSINGSFALTISGTFADPSVALTMSATGFQDLSFTGSLTSGTSMTGTLNGSGFNGFSITLNKN